MLVSLVSTYPSLPPGHRPTATIDSGVVTGVATTLPNAKSGVHKFLGILYSSPAGRWGLPRTVEPWHQPRDADTIGPICIQAWNYNGTYLILTPSFFPSDIPSPRPRRRRHEVSLRTEPTSRKRRLPNHQRLFSIDPRPVTRPRRRRLHPRRRLPARRRRPVRPVGLCRTRGHYRYHLQLPHQTSLASPPRPPCSSASATWVCWTSVPPSPGCSGTSGLSEGTLLL